MSKRPKGATVQVGLRLKEGMRAALEMSAKTNGVSLNAEIVRRLDQSFRKEELEKVMSKASAEHAENVEAMVQRAVEQIEQLAESHRKITQQAYAVIFERLIDRVLEHVPAEERRQIPEGLAEGLHHEAIAAAEHRASELMSEAAEIRQQAGQQRKRGTK